jgi:hypothetical protein
MTEVLLDFAWDEAQWKLGAWKEAAVRELPEEGMSMVWGTVNDSRIEFVGYAPGAEALAREDVAFVIGPENVLLSIAQAREKFENAMALSPLPWKEDDSELPDLYIRAENGQTVALVLSSWKDRETIVASVNEGPRLRQKLAALIAAAEDLWVVAAGEDLWVDGSVKMPDVFYQEYRALREAIADAKK